MTPGTDNSRKQGTEPQHRGKVIHDLSDLTLPRPDPAKLLNNPNLFELRAELRTQISASIAADVTRLKSALKPTGLPTMSSNLEKAATSTALYPLLLYGTIHDKLSNIGKIEREQLFSSLPKTLEPLSAAYQRHLPETELEDYDPREHFIFDCAYDTDNLTTELYGLLCTIELVSDQPGLATAVNPDNIIDPIELQKNAARIFDQELAPFIHYFHTSQFRALLDNVLQLTEIATPQSQLDLLRGDLELHPSTGFQWRRLKASSTINTRILPQLLATLQTSLHLHREMFESLEAFTRTHSEILQHYKLNSPDGLPFSRFPLYLEQERFLLTGALHYAINQITFNWKATANRKANISFLGEKLGLRAIATKNEKLEPLLQISRAGRIIAEIDRDSFLKSTKRYFMPTLAFLAHWVHAADKICTSSKPT